MEIDEPEPNDNDERYYKEGGFSLEARLVLLPGESGVEYELLHTRLAEEWAPEGVLEEDAVSTIAKCIWRKRRYQNLLKAKLTAALFDPGQQLYDEQQVLSGLLQVLNQETDADELERWLATLSGRLEQELRTTCPRKEFATTKRWIEALRSEAGKLYQRAERFGRPPDEVLLAQSAAVLTDEVFARELEFEERIDAALDRARNRLFEIRSERRLISFRARERFDRSHRTRLAGIRRRKIIRVDPTDKESET